ncbi:hypothetical protein NQ317_004341 [Molorchus minor]|uniref:THAP-type domain-containing protein n=1 Tax=Molorchus minor TaxID=1323400 RepID=A0ABQ9J2P4_9CUCU|nr:hypothetical protein NQ317_004341 [Molorchus minor]
MYSKLKRANRASARDVTIFKVVAWRVNNFQSLACGSNSARDLVSFFRIPSEYDNHKQFNKLASERRKAWINRLKRADLTESKIKNGRICSKHFISVVRKVPVNAPVLLFPYAICMYWSGRIVKRIQLSVMITISDR